MMKKTLFLFLIISFSLIYNSASFSEAIYKWIDKDGVIHFSNTPISNNNTDNLETVVNDSTGSNMLVFEKINDKLQISNIKQSWYLSSSSMQKEKIYHPQIKFKLKNISNIMISRIKLRVIFIEKGNQIFGKDNEYIDDLPSGYISQTIFMHPAMGFVYNEYNKNTITNKKIDIELYCEINGGEESLIKKMVFSSRVTQ